MIVVTGAAGFIGSNVVAALNERGHTDVAVCDWLGQDQRWMNLRKRMFRHFVFPEDLMGFLDEAKEVEAIIHMGANSATTATDGDSVVRTNLQFSLKLLDWCTENGVPLVYASSAATYGDGNEGFDDGLSLASLRRLRPLNLYGWSKHQFDLIVAERAEFGLALPPKCVGLKFFNVFGQNEYHKGDMMSVLAKNYDTVAAGGEVKLFKSHRNDYVDGGQKRDFVYVDDVVEVILWALEQGPRTGLFNVGTGQATPFKDLIEALFAAASREPRIAYIPMPETLRGKYQYFTEAPLANLHA
ncbi:MAG TPA: ADP-glyceromanno-heptose 6-epimerase, partial [Reyranella sp.]